MRIRNYVLLAIGMICMVGALVSCGSEKEETLEGQVITIGRWGGNDAETAAFYAMLEGFTAATGITVEERIYSDFNQEIQAELIGGTAPDVFYVDANIAPFFVQQEVLMPLDAKEFELDTFYPSIREAFQINGEYYAVGKDFSTLALYYNKAWVDPNTIPATYEELIGGSYLTDLSKTLPEGVYPMSYVQDLARNMFIAQNDGADITRDEIYSNLGDSRVIANLATLYDAAAAGVVKTPADIGMGWNGDAFGNEKIALMIEGNWTLGFLQQNFPHVDFGTMEIPAYKGEKGTMVFTVGYGVNAATKKENAAKAFVQYATGKEGMAIWTTGAGVLPARIDVAEETKVAEDSLQIAHLKGAEYATPWQKSTTLVTINSEFQNYIPSVVSGDRTLQEALTIAEEEANKTIEANQW